MRWYWPPLRLGDVAAIFLCVALAIALLLFVFNPKVGKQSSNFGFGPDWDCINLPHSEPVCVKRVPRGPIEANKPSN